MDSDDFVVVVGHGRSKRERPTYELKKCQHCNGSGRCGCRECKENSFAYSDASVLGRMRIREVKCDVCDGTGWVRV